MTVSTVEMPSRSGDIDRLVGRFRDCELTHAEWTHRAHLIVGLWHVWHHGPDRALVLLRERIRRLNRSLGVANTDDSGYHETVTRFYVHVLDRCRVELHGEDAGPESRGELPTGLCVEVSDRLMADREIALRYYSRELLVSTRARREWVEPDLAPLSDAVVPETGTESDSGTESETE